MLRAAFLTRPTTPALRVVQIATGAPVHCELLFADGRSFSAAPGAGCRYAVLDPPYADPVLGEVSGWWDLYDLPHLDEARARAFCDGVHGLAYDWPAVLLWPLGLQSRTRYLCAEVVAAALVAAGAPPSLLAVCGDPAALNRAVHAYVIASGAPA